MAEQYEEKVDDTSVESTQEAECPTENTDRTVDENAAEETVENTQEDGAEDASDESAAQGAEEDGKKKGFFGKDKKEKKDKKDQKIDELTDQYRRTLAEFDNYRKRTEKEKTAMFEVGVKNIIEKLLPVIDSFERGLATVSDEQKAEPFVEGMDKIYKQLVKQLEDAGVKEIEALDKEFDPNLHNAVMHVEDENVGENIIVEVFQKGYTYRDSVVRHSMVKVAN